LVEQGLKQVVVSSIDDLDSKIFSVGFAEDQCGVQAGKSSAYDHNSYF